MNYVGAARQTTNLRAVQNNLRDAVVAAVYVDRRRSEQRIGAETAGDKGDMSPQ